MENARNREVALGAFRGAVVVKLRPEVKLEAGAKSFWRSKIRGTLGQADCRFSDCWWVSGTTSKRRDRRYLRCW